MRINVVTIYVTDQDKAKSFYAEKLGFKVKDDAAFGPNPLDRWLTVVSPEDEITELYLAHEDIYPGAKAYREAMYAAKKPPVGLTVKDIQATYKALVEKGVEFTREPIQESWGWDAGIDDGCGNIINLHQENR
jgi:catechol 2,3-dioxygenase-like lactoylglutathione lyase family enzyme